MQSRKRKKKHLLRIKVGLRKGARIPTKYTDEFIAFWAKYPKRWIRSSDSYVKDGKSLAFQQWNRRSKADKQYIMVILRQVPSNTSTPDAFRWLRDKKYEDYEIPQKRSRLVPEGRTRPIPTKDPEMVKADKVREEIDKLAKGMKP